MRYVKSIFELMKERQELFLEVNFAVSTTLEIIL